MHGFVMIAITSDAMLQNKKQASLIYPYRRRRRDVADFLKSEGKIEKKDYLIKKIYDKCGFATKIRNVDAIIVTRETERNALLINQKRRKRGWHPLRIVILPYLKDEKGIISSTRFRISCAKARSHAR